jgi:GNAT superfamily N-acetyltransferase
MFILKGHRRRGIGGIFFKDLCIWFRQKKCRYVELSVHSKNMVGKRVWKSFGFEGYLIKERMRFR